MNYRVIVGVVAWFVFYMVIWFAGCAAGEWLELSVPWAMICGIITYQIATFTADAVQDKLTP